MNISEIVEKNRDQAHQDEYVGYEHGRDVDGGWRSRSILHATDVLGSSRGSNSNRHGCKRIQQGSVQTKVSNV